MLRWQTLPMTCLWMPVGVLVGGLLCLLIFISGLLAFQSEVVAYVDNIAGNRDIFLLDLHHNLIFNLTRNPADDSAPTWSPDGTQIAFHSTRNNTTGIFIISSTGRNLRLLIGDNANYPAWSPDGTQLVFRSNRDGNQELYIIHINGINLTRLTDQTASDNLPAWSPDGTRIAFTSNLAGNTNIYLVDVNGTNLQQITIDPAEDTYPQWSPDGTQLAFASNRMDHQTYQIFLYDLSTQSIYPLTEDIRFNNHSPQWLPDGNAIVFQSLGGTYRYTRHTYRINIDNGVVSLLTNYHDYMEMVAWKP